MLRVIRKHYNVWNYQRKSINNKMELNFDINKNIKSTTDVLNGPESCKWIRRIKVIGNTINDVDKNYNITII